MLASSPASAPTSTGVDPRLRCVMYPSDFSCASLGAFPYAVSVARRDGAELIILRISASPAFAMSDMMSVDHVTWLRTICRVERAAEDQLHRLVTNARDCGVRATGLMMRRAWLGLPEHMIVSAAGERRVDLLVVGIPGRARIRRLFRRTLAERIVATASCPVLTVRALRCATAVPCATCDDRGAE